ncbi:alpha-amylase [Panacibacter ginsenosidivorans]|uniref:Alpha-amylase n=1 Tax=Panacibacter ginsenosidivorans TaxID=1813871 RepID=A0A5B8VAV7_9BACT|nr:alpha-amylase family glycosyl hydrolase [Panacibacter ginsenosidivorans]QEC67438.1 alpha-amylase [Panacibacter ginsenosidivorans]
MYKHGRFIYLLALAVVIFSCKTNIQKQEDVAIVTKDTAMIDGHPSWIMQGNVYEVNVRQYTPQGTFKAFEPNLQRLKDMGVQTLWFMPINPISKVDRKGALGSYYAVSNYDAINPEFGTMDDWKALVKKCHDMGFKVIIDWVPNHTGGDHYWLEQHPDFFVKDSTTGKALSPFDWSDTRQLDYKNPVLQDSMINAMKYWITNSDIDGFRCDVAWNVPDDFWKKCIPQLRAMKNIFMLAESNKAAEQLDGFDATYPWDEFNMMKLIAKGERPAFALDSVVNHVDSAFPKNGLLLYFTSNHDENSWNKADYKTMPGASHAPFAVLTQTMKRSVPLIYSGQEEPFLDSISFFYKDTITLGKYGRADFYKTLLELRNSNAALAGNASFTKIKTNNDASVYAYLRQKGTKKVLVILNLSNKAVDCVLNNSMIEGKAINVFSKQAEDLKRGQIFKLRPWDYFVYSY